MPLLVSQQKTERQEAFIPPGDSGWREEHEPSTSNSDHYYLY